MTSHPDTIKVNGRNITIKYSKAEKLPGACGVFFSQKSRIELSKDQEPQELRDTLLHEILHAILHTQGREYGGEIEEIYVRALATGLLGVFQDNPELHQWLIQAEPPP